MSRRMRIAVFGTPAYAVPTLAAVAGRHDVVLVVARPDRPVGRGHELRSPPTIEWAREHGVDTRQPVRLRGNQPFAGELARLDLDVAVTIAYGAILPPQILDAPRHGFLNAHASLLPRYRGAAPIQRALIDGVDETGITIMQTEVGLDTGPIRWVVRTRFLPGETASDAFPRLAALSADAMVEALDRLAEGTLPSTPQDDGAATYAPMLEKDDGRVRWEDDALSIEHRYRGVHAWPGTFTTWRGATVKLGDLSVPSDDASPERDGGDGDGTYVAPGTVVSRRDEALIVACGRGWVRVGTATPPGKRTMSAAAWSLGQGPKVGEVVA